MKWKDEMSIRWRRLDRPGFETARLSFDGEGGLRHLVGSAEFDDGGRTCRLDYAVTCRPGWETLSAKVDGTVGDQPIDVEVVGDAGRRWRLNGVEEPAVAGCIDVDLNFSPSTNLLPIRRLDLAFGEEARVIAAWLRFPTFRLEPLEQVYRRTGESTYRYESAGGRFAADLEVDEAGFVVDYAGIWRRQEAP